MVGAICAHVVAADNFYWEFKDAGGGILAFPQHIGEESKVCCLGIDGNFIQFPRILWPPGVPRFVSLLNGLVFRWCDHAGTTAVGMKIGVWATWQKAWWRSDGGCIDVIPHRSIVEPAMVEGWYRKLGAVMSHIG